MKNSPRQIAALVLVSTVFFGAVVRAQNPDAIGVTLLRAVTTNLNGAGIRVAQPEAGAPAFEVNPTNVWVKQPVNLFTYISSGGSTNNFPNYLGSESTHADTVASNFYGLPGGVATNVAHVDNYDANYFIQVSEIPAGLTTNYSASLSAASDDSVVNQSFIFTDSDGGSVPTNEQQAIDSAYDDFAAQHNVLFISGAGNGSPARVCPPATCYNGIGVGAYIPPNNYSSSGPTLDNGRAKPDITAPSSVTSFSTPQVAGAAALLMQAGVRGDGSGDTNSASDIRTIKSLLLNGAIKPNDWTNIAPSPFDTRYGAGVLNVFNSYKQLAGGKHGYIVSTTVSAGGAHPPTGAGGTIVALSGWDFNTNTSTSFPSAQDGVKHYYFNVTNSTGNAAFTATATLVWNRQQNETDINNLNLYLYNAANSNLVAASTSAVDNVEHIFLPKLAQGRYDLQVWMSASGISSFNNSETYALAWEFFSQSANISKSGTNLNLSWPVYPDGFVVEATTNLVSASWSTNNLPSPVVVNNQNVISLGATNGVQFFRLRRP